MRFEEIIPRSDPFVVGVISDTHIPDRLKQIPKNLLDQLSQSKVEIILHGGDISKKSVLVELEKIAPVLAVTGNRDILLAGEIPSVRQLKIFDHRLVLTHGHLGPVHYWVDKYNYLTKGYVFGRYQQLLSRAFPNAQVIIFGHTHHPENRWVNGKLFFNPGSVSHGDYLDRSSTFGVLKFYSNGKIESNIHQILGN